MLTLVIGGSASGKSEYAESLLALATSPQKHYVATMEVWDEESRQRVQRHRTLRAGKGFSTVECPTHLSSLALSGGVLVECLGNLVANELYTTQGAGEHTVSAILAGIDRLMTTCAPLIIVSNEVFSDGRDYDPSTLTYLRTLADLNRAIAARADCVVEVVCGIPHHHKGLEVTP